MASSVYALHRKVRRTSGHTGLVQRSNGVWHVRIFSGGKEITRTTKCRDESEAALVAARIRMNFDRNGSVKATVPAPVLKVEATIDQVIQLAKEGMHTASAAAKTKTISTYGTKLRKIAALLGVRTVLELESALPQLRERSPDGIALSSLESYLCSAKALFSKGRMAYYRSRGYALADPFKDFHIRKTRPRAVVVIPSQQVQVLKSQAEQLRDSDPPVYRTFLLLLNAGLRAQEVVHLKWEDLNEIGTISIRPDRFSRWRPKHDVCREVPLHDAAFAQLLASRSPDEQDVDYVIRLQHPQKQSFRDEENRAQMVLGRSSRWLSEHSDFLSKVRSPNHALRKYYLSRIANSLGIFIAQQYAGHRSVRTTERYYAALQSLPTVAV